MRFGWCPVIPERLLLAGLIALVLIPASAESPSTETISKECTLFRGAVNGALLKRGGKVLAIYGDPRESPAKADMVLLTHHRRDVAWAGRALVEKGAKAVVPAGENDLFTQVDQFWSKFATARFHDYAQQGTKILTAPIAVTRTVRGGETFSWEDIPIRVLDTPGFTRGAVSYLLKTEGRTVAFTGDLIYGDGRVFDLYSLQDAIPEAKIRGYHGYAGRLADLISSLKKIAAENPDLILPVRGPMITNPQKAISNCIERIQALYSNYLSTDALRWYFGDEHIRAKAQRVLGPTADVGWMPMAEKVQQSLPPWIIPISNSRLILSSDGSGLLVDCGPPGIIAELKKLEAAGTLKSLDQVFVTHYHDDHTNSVSALVKAFGPTVYASRELWDVLENPSAYRLPCLTANPVHVSGRVANGASWRWKEFKLTVFFFPGQTLYHDALLITRDHQQAPTPGQNDKFFFIGDSFTPSGIDDYCLLNRNFLREGAGFFYCLDLVNRAAPEALLINQHVKPAFRFSGRQIAHMRDALKKRSDLLAALLPWGEGNLNFGLDERWVEFCPYALELKKGESGKFALRITNHSSHEEFFYLRLHLPEGWNLDGLMPNPIGIAPYQEGSVDLRITPPNNASPGLHLLTAGIRWREWDLREWTEALVTVIR